MFPDSHSGTNCLLRRSMPELTMASGEPQGFHEVLLFRHPCANPSKPIETCIDFSSIFKLERSQKNI